MPMPSKLFFPPYRMTPSKDTERVWMGDPDLESTREVFQAPLICPALLQSEGRQCRVQKTVGVNVRQMAWLFLAVGR